MCFTHDWPTCSKRSSLVAPPLIRYRFCAITGWSGFGNAEKSNACFSVVTSDDANGQANLASGVAELAHPREITHDYIRSRCGIAGDELESATDADVRAIFSSE